MMKGYDGYRGMDEEEVQRAARKTFEAGNGILYSEVELNEMFGPSKCLMEIPKQQEKRHSAKQVLAQGREMLIKCVSMILKYLAMLLSIILKPFSHRHVPSFLVTYAKYAGGTFLVIAIILGIVIGYVWPLVSILGVIFMIEYWFLWIWIPLVIMIASLVIGYWIMFTKFLGSFLETVADCMDYVGEKMDDYTGIWRPSRRSYDDDRHYHNYS